MSDHQFRTIRLKLLNRALLAVAAMALALLPLLLWLALHDDFSIIDALVLQLTLLPLNVYLALSVFRQRIEIGAAEIAQTTVYGPAQRLAIAAIASHRISDINIWDQTGIRFLEFFGDRKADEPLLSINLSPYAQSDQQFLVDWAEKIAGTGKRQS